MVDQYRKLKIVSLNVRGLSAVAKRRKINMWFKKQGADIIFIQETHCTTSKLQSFQNSWCGESYYSITPSAYSKGVAILFKPNLNLNVIDSISTEDGRQLLLNVYINGKCITLVNVYGPNDTKDRIEFFKDLEPWVMKYSHNVNSMIVAGDLNCCLCDEDRSTGTHYGDKSRDSLANCIKYLNLFDVWKKLKPLDGKHYTWHDKVTSSRLDYFLVSESININIENIYLMTVINDIIGKRPTDHKALVLEVRIAIPSKGPGYWKLNNMHLNDKEYNEGIRNIIGSLPIDNKLEGVHAGLKWDVLKARFKEYSIRYGVKKAKQKRDEIKELECEIKMLDDKANASDMEIMRKVEIQIRLDELYTEEVIGAQIRAKVDEINEVEHNAELFKAIEKSRQSNNVIESLLKEDNTETSNQNEILNEIGKFYSTLYKKSCDENRNISDFLEKVNIERVLNEKQKAFLEKMPTIEEITVVIQKINEKRSPGLDGLSIEFYKTFWESFKLIYFDMIIDSWQSEILPHSTRTSVLTTIHKTQAKNRLSNYRPLSLTNTDYKIIAAVFSERLQSVMSSIISSDQTAYLKERFIGTSVRNLLDIYEYCEHTGAPGALLCIDFLKAFDSVEHDFIFESLKRFNFGANFIKWVYIMYNEPNFKVKNNGWLSDNYTMTRGIRQGCSLSALLFVIVVEVLASMIRQNENIKGVLINGNEHKIIQYADDATICVRHPDSIRETLYTINEFSRYAGLKLNLSKTKGIWLGNLKELGYRQFEEISWTGNPVKCLGIYIGHNKEKCSLLNWDKKLDIIKQTLERWECRKLTLFGKVRVIKTYAISKIVYPATVLVVPDFVKKRLKEIVFKYLWGKRDSVKRSNVIYANNHGGLNMIDIESFFESLKAAWVPRLLNSNGKWKDYFIMLLSKIGFNIDYILKTSFRTNDSFPVLNNLSPFYQSILLAFNKAKAVVPFDRLSVHEILQLPLWGCEYFKIRNTCLYLDGWINNNMFFVKDLINVDGSIKNDKELFECTTKRITMIKDAFIVKNYVIKRIIRLDVTIGPFVNIRPLTHILYKKGYIELKACKSNIFYQMLVKKVRQRGNMESIYSNEFSFDNNFTIWKNIYGQ